MYRQSLALLILLAWGDAALAKEIHECLGAGVYQEIRIEQGEWYQRGRGEPWKMAGCRPAAADPRSECSFSGNRTIVRTAQGDRHPDQAPGAPVLEQVLDITANTYSYTWQGMAGSQVLSLACERYREGETPPSRSWPLTRKIAAGLPFLLVLERGALDLKRGEWSPEQGRWVVVEGKYYSDSGTWASSGVGFQPIGNPLHSCPGESRCGGIHESGARLERWYRPEDREMIAFGNRLSFNDAGEVFRGGRKVGNLLTPEF